MQKLVISGLILLTWVFPCFAEPFHLKHDTTGKLYGPFEFKNGAKVLIGKTMFTLVRPESHPQTLAQKLKSIKIPELNFRMANIHDVVDFLRQASVDFDTSKGPRERKGVNIILNLKEGTDLPLITFSARYISLAEALKVITQVANLQYRVQDNVIMIEPKK